MTAHFGNCISPRKLDGHPRVSPHIYGVPAHGVPIDPSVTNYGTTLTEQSLPAGPFVSGGEGWDGVEGSDLVSPILCVVPCKTGNPDECTVTNKGALVPELQSLGFDWVVGIDAGGDSLTGGIDFQAGGSPELGRDRQMLHVLSATGIPFTHLVVAPCCDGESEQVEMQKALETCAKEGQVQGVFGIESLIPFMQQLVVGQGSTRTPNIMLRAFARDLPVVEVPGDIVVVPRNRNPAIDRSWLLCAVALTYASALPQAIIPD